jgi:hypothetical protein
MAIIYRLVLPGLNLMGKCVYEGFMICDPAIVFATILTLKIPFKPLRYHFFQ